MKLISTNGGGRSVSLREAVFQSMPQDGGLYIPEKIPRISDSDLAGMKGKSLPEIAFMMSGYLLAEALPAGTLQNIIDDAFNFDAPLVQLSPSLHVLELFHGPTLAFKDFAARFMARLMASFNVTESRERTILVATSGDTGGAVAHAYYRVPGIRVFILYPSGKVSDVQELQLTTLGENITALEVDGTFDDCQRVVKAAFADARLAEKHLLTSANSINISRLIPQSFYYGYLWTLLAENQRPLIVSVPSGNLGNLTAGLLAKKMGIPISHFIAAANANDVLPAYLASGMYEPRKSLETYSNAMDVGAPSNFSRMLHLYENAYAALRKDISGYSISDEQTIATMKSVADKYGYVSDPHGAVGFAAMQKYLKTRKDACCGVVLETAHPAKFPLTISLAHSHEVPMPAQLESIRDRVSQKTSIPASLDALSAVLTV